MNSMSRTWWGQEFIGALESFTDPARLGRGRSYARGGKILKFKVTKGKITATVRGSVNPYFGVYEEPRYRTEIAIAAITPKDWTKIVEHLATKASWVAKLLLNEVPENIESSFAAVNCHFLPHSQKDFQTSCSCPDYSNPCKHIAGLCYRFAAELDEDPFLLFELRGLSREDLKAELLKTRLGKALAAGLMTELPPPEPVASYYTQPQTKSIAAASLKEFWLGNELPLGRGQASLLGSRFSHINEGALSLPSPKVSFRQKTLPTRNETEARARVPGILVKKQGDFPPFWHQEHSFLEVMEEIYERVKTKNRNIF